VDNLVGYLSLAK